MKRGVAIAEIKSPKMKILVGGGGQGSHYQDSETSVLIHASKVAANLDIVPKI